MRYGTKYPWGWIIGGIAALILVLVIVVGTSYYHDSTVRVAVTGKESVNTSDGHEYRIYANDEVYVMEDSIIKGRFRTANDYARLQPHHTYECKAWGWRVPLLSMFKNLRDCKEVPR